MKSFHANRFGQCAIICADSPNKTSFYTSVRIYSYSA